MLAQIGTRVRRLMAFALVAVMMFGSLVSPASTLAQGQSIQSSLTGVTISYGAPYELQEDGRFADDVMETMMFLGSADILAMGFMTPLIDLTGARDIMLEELFGEIGSSATIDRGDYTGVSYSLDMLNIDGLEMGVFSLFMNQRAHGFSEFYIFLAPPAFFGTAMQTAQNSFTIDGAQLMNGVDATSMGNMVTANIGITGGTAVTDVTDVTDTSANTSETTQTETTQAETTTPETTTGSIDQGAQLTYLLAITFEYGAVDQSLANIWTSLTDLSNDAIAVEAARPIIDEEQDFLRGTNDRVALIEVPAGMEEFHQEVLVWSDAVTNSGVTWFAALDGNATQEAAYEALDVATTIHIEFGDTLQAQNVIIADGAGENGTSESPAPDTPETESTAPDTTQPGSTATDAESYVEAVQNHRAAFLVSLGVWSDSLDSMGENPTDADRQRVREATIAEAEYWATFSAGAQQFTPPAGYESVHEQYLVWADEITELGNLWIGAMNGRDADLDAFGTQLTVVVDADDQLAAELDAAAQQSGDTSTQTSSGSDTTTGRTTRTSDSSGTSESTETPSRTSRTGDSGNSSDSPDSGATNDRTSRSSRGGDSSTTTNTSETGGNTSGTTATEIDEWFMEVTGATITWNDDFELNTSVTEPQVNDPDAGEDRISLQTTTSDGETVAFNVTVYANTDADSTPLIEALASDPDMAVMVYGESAEVLDYEITAEASAALVHAVDDIGAYYVYVQVTCVTQNCDTVSLLVIATEGYPLLDTLDAMENGVSIDGVSISTAIPGIYVEEAVDQFGN